MDDDCVITIRKATEQDRASLEECFVALQEYERSMEADRSDPQAIVHRYIDSLFAECVETAGAIFLAEQDGKGVGFVCVLSRVRSRDIIERELEHAYITDLVVLEPYRGLGIGAQLMRVAEGHAASNGASRVRIGVLAANIVAQALYHKLGYRDYETVLQKAVNSLHTEAN